MKFVPLTDAAASGLAEDYRAGRGVGPLTLGRRFLFLRKLLTAYYIPYPEIGRYFRRVEAVPAKIGCCTGEVRVENVVVCARSDGRELIQAQLPGERAALAVMEELRRLAPDAASGCPPKSGEAAP